MLPPTLNLISEVELSRLENTHTFVLRDLDSKLRHKTFLYYQPQDMFANLVNFDLETTSFMGNMIEEKEKIFTLTRVDPVFIILPQLYHFFTQKVSKSLEYKSSHFQAES